MIKSVFIKQGEQIHYNQQKSVGLGTRAQNRRYFAIWFTQASILPEISSELGITTRMNFNE